MCNVFLALISFELHVLKTYIKLLGCFWKFFCIFFSYAISMYITKISGLCPNSLFTSPQTPSLFYHAFSMRHRPYPLLHNYQPTEKLLLAALWNAVPILNPAGRKLNKTFTLMYVYIKESFLHYKFHIQNI